MSCGLRKMPAPDKKLFFMFQCSVICIIVWREGVGKRRLVQCTLYSVHSPVMSFVMFPLLRVTLVIVKCSAYARHRHNAFLACPRIIFDAYAQYKSR
jgi:hypothetical protein